MACETHTGTSQQGGGGGQNGGLSTNVGALYTGPETAGSLPEQTELNSNGGAGCQGGMARRTHPCLPGSMGISEVQKQFPGGFCCCHRGERVELPRGKPQGQPVQQQGPVTV